MLTLERVFVAPLRPDGAVFLGGRSPSGLILPFPDSSPTEAVEEKLAELHITPLDYRVTADVLLYPQLDRQLLQREVPWPDQTHLVVLLVNCGEPGNDEGWYQIEQQGTVLTPALRLWLPEALRLDPTEFLEVEIETSRTGTCVLRRHCVRELSADPVAA